MIRVGDVLHTCVFAGCVAGGALISLTLHRGAMLGMGYGLVVWVALVLAYLAVGRVCIAGRAAAGPDASAAPAQPEVPGTVDEDAPALEAEDGRRD